MTPQKYLDAFKAIMPFWSSKVHLILINNFCSNSQLELGDDKKIVSKFGSAGSWKQLYNEQLHNSYCGLLGYATTILLTGH
jgi:hypothetical protein